MRTQIMIDLFEKNNGYALDTCFIIQVFKNPEIISFYFQKRVYGSKIIINEISLNELEHNEFDKAKVLLRMKEIFGKIMVKDVTNEERMFGQKLEKICPMLHSGDSAILAFAKRTSTCLVTLDKMLAKSCQFLNVNCIFFNITQKQGANLHVF